MTPPELQRTREVRTGCPYCGTGCGLIGEVAGGRLQAVKGDPLQDIRLLEHPAAVIKGGERIK